MANFNLKPINENLKPDSPLNSLFQRTDNSDIPDLMIIPPEQIHHFKNHPFKLYEGQRFLDMVQSVKENGLFTPLIVREIPYSGTGDNQWEILSGHNRYEACKVAGLGTIPCIVKKDLTEDEAYLIVTESNLLQRSFADLTHSERAVTLATHYEALKSQGKRKDLVADIEKMILMGDKAHDTNENQTLVQVGLKLNSAEQVGENYGLSVSNLKRYLRINKLITMLKDMLDSKELPLVAGVSLSYLTHEEQNLLMDYVDDNEQKIDIKKAEMLKALSEQKKFTTEKIAEIFLGKKVKSTPKKQSFVKIKLKKYQNYFANDETVENIENTFEKALAFYFEYKDGFPESNVDADFSESDG